MAAVDHWHPVARSEDLGRKPLGVNVAGREVVLFRASTGALGALTDRCPHRGMRLSTGSVEGERLVCPYHGWRWATDGRGIAPGTPTAKPCAERFDVVERLGAVWVKSSGSSPAFPRWDVEGWTPVGRLVRRVKAPLELVLDNFIEVEHTPTTHAMLGHPVDRMAEVECVTTVTDDSVRVYNKGRSDRSRGPCASSSASPTARTSSTTGPRSSHPSSPSTTSTGSTRPPTSAPQRPCASRCSSTP
ncbi:MAG: Rieske 2Fe-2S domain-containing protein [Polyangiales bacterium]